MRALAMRTRDAVEMTRENSGGTRNRTRWDGSRRPRLADQSYRGNGAGCRQKLTKLISGFRSQGPELYQK